MNTLPVNLYTPDDVRKLDECAIASGIPGYTLMRRAGQAVFDAMLDYFPDANNILVLCGAGNNAGDGYVLARLADKHGLKVSLVSLVEAEKLKGDALQAWQQWDELGNGTEQDVARIEWADVVIDAMLGTGLDRDVEGDWRHWIEAVNASAKPVIAVDVPSGLDALTGAIRGSAIRADVTVSFIGLKAGLFTASGRACCGELEFDDLGVPTSIFDSVPAFAERLDESACRREPRWHDSHKGDYGHVLVIGGNHGMPGAVILAARAALRSGAGLVSVVTREAHITAVAAACPEAMVHASINGELPDSLPQKCTAIAIGPGLGKDAWAHRLMMNCRQLDVPLVLDADALRMFKQHNIGFQQAMIITPHPGEAAMLLSTGADISAAAVQANRFDAIRELHMQSGACVVLKGSGTLIYDGRVLRLCSLGNPAMASAGMGDVLSGVIAALLARGLSTQQAASQGVCLHAAAGDAAASDGAHSLLASDVIEALPYV